ncbi:MAG: zinc ABC transporter substrate-binding protein [Gammaproteobacteria bacterium HGW-Gammaproteobacteria-14]|nr:MAG: zinc ABC transporter substrate-binding protein [Gammaproteobacteria bacterium HGW-Gammaproteobacteria-14]
MKKILLLSCALLLSSTAHSQLRVVASTTNMAMLANTVGGTQVSVTHLAPPDRDAHHLAVRPSMMTALRQADLLVSVGAELEAGWLMPALQGAGNPKLNPGQLGYFEAAAQVTLIDPQPQADRSQGDVHPTGNPHIYLDPPRLARAGLALAEAMAALAPEHGDYFRHNAASFAEQVDTQLPHWQSLTQNAAGVLLYHADANYLARLLSVPVLGYMEPLPGIPPSGRHLSQLVSNLKGKAGVLIMPTYQPARAATLIEQELGWPVIVLPSNVAAGGTSDDYLALIKRWAQAFAAAQKPAGNPQ